VVRRLEARLSIHLDSTPLARFNRAPAHRWVELGEETVRLLERARRLSRATGGAFDITCGPQVALWRQAGKENRLPTPAQVEAARARSGWELLELAGSRARKGAESLALDLGGIAKGEAIDRALAVLAAAGCAGGLVEIGGDLRCFGRRPGGRPWEILVRDPYRPGESCASLEVGEGALCTSGDYFRYTEIEGRRYSHILDPRTGRPAGQASSVTVLAPRAVVADAWATALSVLGPEGLDRVESRPGLEALMIVGGPGRSRHLATSGFPPTTGPE
jgi:thiamine biosynthesis lipoprotein